MVLCVRYWCDRLLDGLSDLRAESLKIRHCGVRELAPAFTV
jgi:hypothetical protein